MVPETATDPSLIVAGDMLRKLIWVDVEAVAVPGLG
jgi:hypothetical protein